MFVIKPDGGNRNHGWRVVLETADEATARARFDEVVRRMRQGGVVLLEVTSADERVLLRAVAPRLRTRW